MRCHCTTCDKHRDPKLLAEQAVTTARLAYRERELANSQSGQMARRHQRHYEAGISQLAAMLESGI